MYTDGFLRPIPEKKIRQRSKGFPSKMVTSHLSKETRLRKLKDTMKGLPVLLDHPSHSGALKSKVGIKMRGLLSSFLVYMLTTKKKITDAM